MTRSVAVPAVLWQTETQWPRRFGCHGQAIAARALTRGHALDETSARARFEAFEHLVVKAGGLPASLSDEYKALRVAAMVEQREEWEKLQESLRDRESPGDG